ncbi:hypothetical protein JCM10207_002362 [Rhodosporidiobolus poonsookiae]
MTGSRRAVRSVSAASDSPTLDPRRRRPSATPKREDSASVPPDDQQREGSVAGPERTPSVGVGRATPYSYKDRANFTSSILNRYQRSAAASSRPSSRSSTGSVSAGSAAAATVLPACMGCSAKPDDAMKCLEADPLAGFSSDEEGDADPADDATTVSGSTPYKHQTLVRLHYPEPNSEYGGAPSVTEDGGERAEREERERNRTWEAYRVGMGEGGEKQQGQGARKVAEVVYDDESDEDE